MTIGSSVHCKNSYLIGSSDVSIRNVAAVTAGSEALLKGAIVRLLKRVSDGGRSCMCNIARDMCVRGEVHS